MENKIEIIVIKSKAHAKIILERYNTNKQTITNEMIEEMYQHINIRYGLLSADRKAVEIFNNIK